MNTRKKSIIYKNVLFTIEHVLAYAVPRYLILYFNDPSFFKEHANESLSKFGILLSKTMECIKEIIHPEKIYCLMFGEKEEKPHFHLFPRTQTITNAYYQATGVKEGTILGPELFTWVIKNKKGRCRELNSLVKCLQEKLKQLINN